MAIPQIKQFNREIWKKGKCPLSNSLNLGGGFKVGPVELEGNINFYKQLKQFRHIRVPW